MMSSEDIMTTDRKRRADRCSRNATSASAEQSDSIDQTINCAGRGDFLEQTIAVWQPYADRSLTREDAREIAHNIVGFFGVLREWAKEERDSAASAESLSPAQVNGGTESDSRPYGKESTRIRSAN
jgi:hypothetical protein